MDFFLARRVRIAKKPPKNGKESCKKDWLNREKHYLSLAGESFRNQDNFKRKREAGNVRRKREVSGQSGRVGISVNRLNYLRVLLIKLN